MHPFFKRACSHPIVHWPTTNLPFPANFPNVQSAPNHIINSPSFPLSQSTLVRLFNFYRHNNCKDLRNTLSPHIFQPFFIFTPSLAEISSHARKTAMSISLQWDGYGEFQHNCKFVKNSVSSSSLWISSQSYASVKVGQLHSLTLTIGVLNFLVFISCILHTPHSSRYYSENCLCSVLIFVLLGSVQWWSVRSAEKGVIRTYSKYVHNVKIL